MSEQTPIPRAKPRDDEILSGIEERLERIEGHLNLLLRAKGFDPDNLPDSGFTEGKKA